MGWYVRRSMKIAPGVRVNFSNRGLGMSVGTRGVHISQSATGRRTFSAGLPGTGIRYRETVSTKRTRAARAAAPEPTPVVAPEVSNLPPKVKTTTPWRVLGWFVGVMLLIAGLGEIVSPATSPANPWWYGPSWVVVGVVIVMWLRATRHAYRVPRVDAE